MTVDLDSFKWWSLAFHKVVTGIGVGYLAIDKIWERFWKVEELIERRSGIRRPKMLDVLSKLSVIEKIIPILEVVLKEIGPMITNVGGDIAKIYMDTEKLIVDLKNNLASIKTGITTAINPVPPPT